MIDLLVVGGGPAGTAAAITARQAGLATMLIERAREPAPRPGETLHPGLEPLFQRLGVRDAVHAAGFVRHLGQAVQWGRSARRFVPFGRDVDGPWRGFQAVRERLDLILMQRAAELGVDVRRGVEADAAIVERGAIVGLRTSEGTVHARMFVDGTGGRRLLSGALRLSAETRSPRLVARYGHVTGSVAEVDDAPLLQGDASGWTWIARVGEQRYAWVRLSLSGEPPAREYLPALLSSCLAEGASHGADVTWRRSVPLAGPGWFLAGDAGAVIDPAAGHGVLRAVMTGIHAAHMAAGVLHGKIGAEAAAAEHDGFVAEWFRRDVAALSQLYCELRGALPWRSFVGA